MYDARPSDCYLVAYMVVRQESLETPALEWRISLFGMTDQLELVTGRNVASVRFAFSII